MFIEILLIIFTATCFMFLFHRRPKGIPPGEWGLPVVGYVPFTNWKLSKTLKILGEKHGKIFSLKLGAQTFIVINDYSLLKEAFSRTEISGRPLFYGVEVLLKYYRLGIFSSNGKIWSTNRRFALKSLKDFGLGKSKLEEFVLTEAEYLVKDLRENVGTPCRIDWNLNVAVLNVIWRLVANRRYNINDKEIKEFSQNINECFKEIEGPMALLNIFPWLLPFLPKFVKNWMKIDSVERKRDKMLNYILNIIEEHKKTIDSNNPRDYIDKYLTEHDEQKQKPEYSHWGDNDLMVSVFEMFIAGSDTTSSTLHWFFLYMAKYPKVQKKVQEEIDKVLPRDKLPSLLDKERLPCLQALSFEVGRKVSLLPTTVPHQVTEDTMLAGYNIPKGSIVVPDVESIHSDSKYFENSKEFSLENFLDQDGKFVPKEGLLSFSIGKRMCIGENLAKMELFIFMGSILQNFDIFEPEGENISLIPDQAVNQFNFPVKCNILLKNRA